MKKYIDAYQKLDDKLSHLKKTCKCGHTQIVPVSSRYEYVLCKYCGTRLYRDNKKQREYDKKVRKNDFVYKLNKCLKYLNKDVTKTDKRIVNKDKLKKKYFDNNFQYFNFSKKPNITIYIVTKTDSGRIKVYYGPKKGRPRKNIR